MKSLSISEARARLPELVRYLRRSPNAVIYIHHRDMAERLVLMTEGQLRLLASTRGAGRPEQKFQLEGSMKSDLTDDELERALAASREEERLRSELKAKKASRRA